MREGEPQEQSERKTTWQKKEDEVEKIPHIENGAKKIVTTLNISGILTSQSCEGHLEEGKITLPFVEISAPNQPEERFIGQEKIIPEVAKKYGVSIKDVGTMLLHSAPWEEFEGERETPDYKKWREENKKTAENAESLLKDFYKDSATSEDVRLTINELNAGQFEMTNARGNETPKTEAKQQLEQYQDEMNNFAQFLKEKYFEGDKNQINITEMDNSSIKTGSRITESDIIAQKIVDQEELAKLRSSLGLLDQKQEHKPGLYDIEEINGTYEVILPGLTWAEREAVVGTIRKHFENRQDAENAVTQARKETGEFYERASLQKTFSAFYRVDEMPDGKFRVVLPGLVDSKTGRYFGTTHKDFDSWQEAKEYYLQDRENDERLTKNPLLEIKTGKNEKIAFSDLDAFNPRIAPTEKPHKIPSSIQKYFEEQGRFDGNNPGASTYQETIKQKNWQNGLYSFLSSYLAKDGAAIIKELNIKHLDALTPKQAIELATQIVIDLTKYKKSDTIKQRRQRGEDLSEKTRADKNTVLQILKEGQTKRNDPNWEGNGVCRNFACSVKAVFEALKAKQTKFNLLQNTYCLFESGTEGFESRRKSIYDRTDSGHAWNTFVTVSKEGAANATIVDATWAKRDLETKKITGLDYTLERMEPMVYESGQKLSGKEPDYQEQIQHLLSYYDFKIDRLKRSAIEAEEEEKQYFISRAVDLASIATSRSKASIELPKNISTGIDEKYFTVTDMMGNSRFKDYSIEHLYHIYQNGQSFNITDILKNSLGEINISLLKGQLNFRDDNLQKLVFDAIKSRPDFEDILKQDIDLRLRFLKINPKSK